MIELDTGTAPKPDAAGAIIDVTDQSFMADVIEASKDTPVIVDFWAPWCGPCKQLTPALEEAVRGARGAVKLAKVNIDENQAVAGQLRVQSIPTVFAFFQGQPVDAFQGALPGSEVKAFVKKLADMAGGDGGLDEALDQADAMLDEGKADDAAQVFGAIMAEDPANGRALGGLARALLAAGHAEEAERTLDAAPAELAEDPHVKAARSAVDLAKAAEGAGEVGELRAKVQADPADHQARYDLGVALLAQQDNAGAIEELLELFRRDREWNDGAAKEQLLKIFDSLGPKDPVAQSGRRRLSSMIFA